MRRARREGVIARSGPREQINTLVAMARSSRGEELGRLHGANASAGEISDLTRDLVEANSAMRVELPGIDAKRADLMPAAAVLVDFIMKKIWRAGAVACTLALREGVPARTRAADRLALGGGCATAIGRGARGADSREATIMANKSRGLR